MSNIRRATGTTFHICADNRWNEFRLMNEYEPEQFEREGFVHCTDSPERLMEIANIYYREDPRPYVALEIDLVTVPAVAIYEDESSEFPHVFGRIPVKSVRNVFRIERGIDGTFIRVTGEAVHP